MILESRGNTPRLYRNTLVFLAADKVRLQDLDEAVRKFLAWRSILDEKDALNLDPHQVKQAETQRKAADSTVTARLPETYQWLLVPVQTSPRTAVEWQALRLTGQDALAARASKKLRSEELLVPALGPTILRKHLDEVPLWRGDHVAIQQLVEDFARYIYLPRLSGPEVLTDAMCDGVGLLTWMQDSFAYADGYDEAGGRYRGLRCGQHVTLDASDSGLLVLPGVASVAGGDRGSRCYRRGDHAQSISRWGTGRCSGTRWWFDGPDSHRATPAETISRQRAPRRHPRGPGRRAHRRRGHRAPGRDRRRTGEGDPGDRGRDPRQRPRPRGPHRDRERPHPEVHQPGVRGGVT